MSFSQKIREEILVASARHCCVCHKPKGVKLEVHHIIPKAEGGTDTFDNAIALCFDCHADAGHYFAKHPKGTKYSPSELKLHKEAWFKNVIDNNIQEAPELQVELSISDKNFDGTFRPVFIEETTSYGDVNTLKRIDYKAMISGMKTGNFMQDSLLDKIQSFEDYVSFINGDFFENADNCNLLENDPQPTKFSIGGIIHGRFQKTTNKSVCLLNLRLTNNGPSVLEDYKVYLDFENLMAVDTADKRRSFGDLNPHKYNVNFSDKFHAVFIPNDSVLVQNDSIQLDKICFKTKNAPTIACINWKLVARDFNTTGRLELNICPISESCENLKYVNNPNSYSSEKRVMSKYEHEYC